MLGDEMMKCKGCKNIEWIPEMCSTVPSELPRCNILDRMLSTHEYLISAPKFCPYRDMENLGRDAYERHECYLVDERDDYKAKAKKYRMALGAIAKQLVYDDEEEVKEWFADIPLDMLNDYMTAFEIAKQALEGDGE